MSAILDNIVWNSLTGRQREFSTGTQTARRYARGFSPIVGFADPQRPDFEALGPYVDADEQFYCDGWSGPAPHGWTVESESTMFKMLFDGEPPSRDPAPDAVRLGASHATAALALATLTRPGPFGPRTIELGEYFGYFEAGRLIAMAGERMHAGQLREISGVCVHPDCQRRGLARRLMSKIVLRQLARGETPFLHAMRANEGARVLYRSLGFRDYRETVVRVVARSVRSDDGVRVDPTARA
jgi:ribosomal protein S18 acetylase RimI-like enzyme